MYWKMFEEAIIGIEAANFLPEFNHIKDVAVKALSEAERFYMPSSMTSLEGLVLDDKVRNYFVLPSDCIAILSEEIITLPNSVKVHGHKISLGISPFGHFAKENRLINPACVQGNDFIVMSILHCPELYENSWSLTPCIVMCVFPKGTLGYELKLINTTASRMLLEASEDMVTSLLNNMKPDASMIMNLSFKLNTQSAAKEIVRVTPTEMSDKPNSEVTVN